MTAASLYVLGIVVMYSTLGVVAALTGGLFGSAFQSVWVNIGLGVLLIALSLSMFGLYEIQPPAWLLTRLGGADTTSVVGLFLSGLAVGIIAAPCVGPFVVAVLALDRAPRRRRLRIQTMFALGARARLSPTCSSPASPICCSACRASGSWMVWVKKGFGAILAAIGVFYLLVAFAPDWAVWVLPGALVAGGLSLGFVDKSADAQRGFRPLRMVMGALAVVAGFVVIVSAPKQSVAFQPFRAGGAPGRALQGHTAMIDFSASWCAPCHELDRYTMTDNQVRSFARTFMRLPRGSHPLRFTGVRGVAAPLRDQRRSDRGVPRTRWEGSDRGARRGLPSSGVVPRAHEVRGGEDRAISEKQG